MANIRDSIVIVGGYGVVGEQIAQILRQKYPKIPIVLAGRNPAKAESLLPELTPASAMKIDLQKSNPLRELQGGKPLALVQAVNDPFNYLLKDALAYQIPLVDITRWTSEFKKAETIVQNHPGLSPVILSSGWMAGLASLIAKYLSQSLHQVDSIDVDILFALKDKAGPNSIEYVDRLTDAFSIQRKGEEQVVQPLSDAKKIRFPTGYVTNAYRFDTPDQYNLPKSCGAEGVNARIAFDDWFANQSLVFLVRTGIWSLIAGDRFKNLRHKLLFNPGDGASHEFVVEVQGSTRQGDTQKIRAEIVDPLGQTHLTAVGAVLQLRRIIDASSRRLLSAGVNLPECVSSEEWWLDYLREQGVMVKLKRTGQADPSGVLM